MNIDELFSVSHHVRLNIHAFYKTMGMRRYIRGETIIDVLGIYKENTYDNPTGRVPLSLLAEESSTHISYEYSSLVFGNS